MSYFVETKSFSAPKITDIYPYSYGEVHPCIKELAEQLGGILFWDSMMDLQDRYFTELDKNRRFTVEDREAVISLHSFLFPMIRLTYKDDFS